jgi:immune inhibitor A
MKFAFKRSNPSAFTAWLLTVLMFTTPLTGLVRAQDIQTGDVSFEEQNDAVAPHVPEGLSEDEEGNIIRGRGDDFKSPQAAEQFKLRQEALKQKLAGKKSGKIHQVAKGQFVELERERNDRVFVIIAEYGEKSGKLPTTTATPAPTPLSTIPGPSHNQISQPDRSTDNSTIWQSDYNSDHYRDMYFNKMAKYYQTQSSGRYTINGDVTEWVKVPFNGPRYGDNRMGDPGAWTFIADAINTWTQAKLDSGMTIEEVTAYLKTFDVWDRYDYDKDGNFDESDGYIDHFQIVHAGDGEETGGGALGSDAIWSHRWFAWNNWRGINGPSFNRNGGVEFGGGWGANPTGATVGSSGALVLHPQNSNDPNAANVANAHPAARTGIWVGDYTIQPENGGLGVFAHEYGHDLGLPDQYDTTNAATNSTAYWTIMSSGSYLGDGQTDVGSTPNDFSAWDKFQLGWLNYDTAAAGVYSDHKLGPAETNTKKAQALVVSLPEDKNVLNVHDPINKYGTKAWWSGKGDSLDTNMIRSIAVPLGTSTAAPILNMRLSYNIESNWDYAYVSISTNNGATWTNLAGTYLNGTAQSALTVNTNLATSLTGNKQNLGNGITGSTNGAWRLASFNMNAYRGQTVLLRLRYKTDTNTSLSGFVADEITFNNTTYIDGAEAGDNGWTLNGFKATTGIESSNAPHFYIAEYRQYRTYDKGLQTGPYVYGQSASGLPSWAHHYPYQDGLLITYWDWDQANNNVSQHRGEGRSIPIDAHPDPMRYVAEKDGQTWTFNSYLSSSVQSYDSTFSLEPTDPISIPFAGILPGTIEGCQPSGQNSRCQLWAEFPSLPAVPVFNDSNSYWSTLTPTAGVIVPNTGTTIRIVNTSAHGQFMQLQVNGEQ